jgi:hypothetical protein
VIEVCLNATYIKIRISKQLSDSSVIRNWSKKGDALSLLIFNVALESKWDKLAYGLC